MYFAARSRSESTYLFVDGGHVREAGKTLERVFDRVRLAQR